jgi:hypothetical protein
MFFSPSRFGRMRPGGDVWRCLASASTRPKCRHALDFLSSKVPQRGFRVIEANAPRCRGFALYQSHLTIIPVPVHFGSPGHLSKGRIGLAAVISLGFYLVNPFPILPLIPALSLPSYDAASILPIPVSTATIALANSNSAHLLLQQRTTA